MSWSDGKYNRVVDSEVLPDAFAFVYTISHFEDEKVSLQLRYDVLIIDLIAASTSAIHYTIRFVSS